MNFYTFMLVTTNFLALGLGFAGGTISATWSDVSDLPTRPGQVLPVGIDAGEDSRLGETLTPSAHKGLEALTDWSELYPTEDAE